MNDADFDQHRIINQEMVVDQHQIVNQEISAMHVKQFGRIWKWANVLHEAIARNDNMMTPKQKIFSLAATGE